MSSITRAAKRAVTFCDMMFPLADVQDALRGTDPDRFMLGVCRIVAGVLLAGGLALSALTSFFLSLALLGVVSALMLRFLASEPAKAALCILGGLWLALAASVLPGAFPATAFFAAAWGGLALVVLVSRLMIVLTLAPLGAVLWGLWEGHHLRFVASPAQDSVRSLLTLYASLTSFLVLVFLLGLFVRKLVALTELRRAAQADLAFSQASLAELGTLSAGAAHEINNPLSIVKGHLGRLQRIGRASLQDHPHGSTLGQTLGRVTAALGRIEDILAVVEEFYDQQKRPVHLVDIDPVEFVKGVHAGDPNQRFTFSVKGADPHLRPTCATSAEDLKIAIDALLQNASESGPQAHPPFVLVDLSQEHGFIVVGDSGDGISADLVSRIWKPFFTTKDLPHRGLGLTRARNACSRAGLELGLVTDQTRKRRARKAFAQLMPDPSTCFVINLGRISWTEPEPTHP